MVVTSGVTLLLTAALLAGAPAAETGCKFPATGQTTCWDSSGTPIPCAGTGQDGDLQAGKTLRYKDKGNGTIEDKVTHLQWEKQSDDGTIHDVGNTYTWANAFALHVAGLNAMNFAGHSDWRLPNVKELQSIIDYEDSLPAVASAFNTNCASSCTVLTCSCTAASSYWSSSTLAAFPTSAWYVAFNFGFVNSDDKSGSAFVRAVRGGS